MTSDDTYTRQSKPIIENLPPVAVAAHNLIVGIIDGHVMEKAGVNADIKNALAGLKTSISFDGDLGAAKHDTKVANVAQAAIPEGPANGRG